MERMQRENANEIDRITWEAKGNLKAKNIQLEATKRAQTLTQHRLKQVEEAINKYMANPILDPTTKIGKKAQVQKLSEDIDELKDLNIDPNKGYRLRFKLKEEEVNELQKQIAKECSCYKPNTTHTTHGAH